MISALPRVHPCHCHYVTTTMTASSGSTCCMTVLSLYEEFFLQTAALDPEVRQQEPALMWFHLQAFIASGLPSRFPSGYEVTVSQLCLHCCNVRRRILSCSRLASVCECAMSDCVFVRLCRVGLGHDAYDLPEGICSSCYQETLG